MGGNFAIKSVKLMHFLKNLGLLHSGAWSIQTSYIIFIKVYSNDDQGIKGLPKL